MAQILLVEPDFILAKTYCEALRNAGHSVMVCTGAQATITVADEKTPDIVILELQLIEHSGIEFLYEFRSYQDWQQIPVIVHTFVPPGEFADNWQLLRGELGVQAYLYKPHTSLRQLTTNVHDHLPVQA